MPFRTPHGSCYHLTIGCHGATIPCDTAGLTPCSDCCLPGGKFAVKTSSSPAAASHATGTGTHAETPPSTQEDDFVPATDGPREDESVPATDGADQTERTDTGHLDRIRAELYGDAPSRPLPVGLTDDQVAGLPREEIAQLLDMATLMTYAGCQALIDETRDWRRRQADVQERYDRLSDRAREIIDSLPPQPDDRVRGVRSKRANKYRGEIYEILVAHPADEMGEGTEGRAELDAKLEEYRRSTGREFPTRMLDGMRRDADGARDALAAALPGMRRIRRVGDSTKSENGDLLVEMEDGTTRTVEVKYAKDGLGTYLNTSIDNVAQSLAAPKPGDDMTEFRELCDRHGILGDSMPTYTQFLDAVGYRDELRAIVGDDAVSEEGQAGFVPDEAENHRIRHDPSLYGQVQEAVTPHTADYRDLLLAYLRCTGQTEAFARGLIDKSVSGKSAPDLILSTTVRRPGEATTQTFSPKAIKEGSDLTQVTVMGDVSMQFDGFRATLSWQNGTGLRNSTMRVFLDE